MPSFDPFGLAAFGRQLQAILNLASRIDGRTAHMAVQLAALEAAVAAENTVIDSAITLLNGLKAALDAAIASGDPAAIQAVSDSINAEKDKLAAAITANTPAA